MNAYFKAGLDKHITMNPFQFAKHALDHFKINFSRAEGAVFIGPEVLYGLPLRKREGEPAREVRTPYCCIAMAVLRLHLITRGMDIAETL